MADKSYMDSFVGDPGTDTQDKSCTTDPLDKSCTTDPMGTMGDKDKFVGEEEPLEFELEELPLLDW